MSDKSEKITTLHIIGLVRKLNATHAKTRSDASVLLTLVTHRGKTGKIHPSIETLCKETGYSRAQVSRALRHWKDLGILTVLRKGTSMGRANEYGFDHKLAEQLAASTTSPERAMSLAGDMAMQGVMSHETGAMSHEAGTMSHEEASYVSCMRDQERCEERYIQERLEEEANASEISGTGKVNKDSDKQNPVKVLQPERRPTGLTRTQPPKADDSILAAQLRQSATVTSPLEERIQEAKQKLADCGQRLHQAWRKSLPNQQVYENEYKRLEKQLADLLAQNIEELAASADSLYANTAIAEHPETASQPVLA